MSPAVKKDKVKAGKREESIEMAQSGKVKMVDFKFIDVPGMWQHVSIPATALKDQFEEGHGFDASSIRGFAHITRERHAAHAGRRDRRYRPGLQYPTLSIICDVAEPFRREV